MTLWPTGLPHCGELTQCCWYSSPAIGPITNGCTETCSHMSSSKANRYFQQGRSEIGSCSLMLFDMLSVNVIDACLNWIFNLMHYLILQSQFFLKPWTVSTSSSYFKEIFRYSTAPDTEMLSRRDQKCPHKPLRSSWRRWTLFRVSKEKKNW